MTNVSYCKKILAFAILPLNLMIHFSISTYEAEKFQEEIKTISNFVKNLKVIQNLNLVPYKIQCDISDISTWLENKISYTDTTKDDEIIKIANTIEINDIVTLFTMMEKEKHKEDFKNIFILNVYKGFLYTLPIGIISAVALMYFYKI